MSKKIATVFSFFKNLLRIFVVNFDIASIVLLRFLKPICLSFFFFSRYQISLLFVILFLYRLSRYFSVSDNSFFIICRCMVSFPGAGFSVLRLHSVLSINGQQFVFSYFFSKDYDHFLGKKKKLM